MAKPQWITIGTPQGSMDGSSEITAASYTGRVNRSGSITGRTTGGATDTTTVTQNGAEEVITITTKTYPADKAGESITISGQSNSANLKVVEKVVVGTATTIQGLTYKLSVEGEPDTSWNGNSDTTVDGDPGASNKYSFVITVVVPENKTDETQTAKLSIQNANGTVTSGEITINQSANTKSYAAPVIQLFNYPAGNISASGGSVTPNLSYSQTWGWGTSTTNGGTLRGTLAEPVAGTTFEFAGATDEETGAVTAPSKGTAVSGVTKVASVTAKVTLNGKSSAVSAAQIVNQDANAATYGEVSIGQDTPVSLDATSQTYTINPGLKQTVSYTSGATRTESTPSDNTVQLSASYVVKTPMPGFSLEDDTGRVIVTANSTASPRNGFVVTINAAGEGSKTATKDITFNQQGSNSTLELSPASMTFEAAGGSKTLTVTSNDSWTLS